MEVIIDGKRYIPEDENVLVVHGVKYNDIPHWLGNIKSGMLQRFSMAARRHENEDLLEVEELQAIDKKICDFDFFCEKYLGFVCDKLNITKYTEKEAAK